MSVATKQPRFDAASFESATFGAKPNALAKRSRYVCLECRTALGDEAVCDGGKSHRVVAADSPAGREALFDEVWGPSSLRRRARELAKAGGTGAAVDSCGDLSGCDCSGIGEVGEAGAVILGLIIAFFVAVLIWWLVTKGIEYYRRRKAQLKPKGALLGPPRQGGAARFGVLKAARASPIAARAIELVQSKVGSNAVMLRYAYTQGLEIAMDDGSVVVVPEGRIRLEGTRSTIDDPSVARSLVDSLVGPPLTDPDGYEVIPYDVAQSVELAVGDRVAVYGPLELSASGDANLAIGGAFRAISRVMVPVGTPSLAKVER